MKKLAIALSIVLSNVAIVHAESAEHGGHAAGHAVHGIESLVWPYINFLIFVGILFSLLRKPFLQAWTTRREGIEAAVNKGANELKAAQDSLAQAKSQLSSLVNEGKVISQSILDDAKAESQQIVEEAKRRSEFVARQTSESLTAERLHAEVKLRREIGQKVLDKAAVLLKSEITPEVDKELRRGVVAGVRQLNQ